MRSTYLSEQLWCRWVQVARDNLLVRRRGLVQGGVVPVSLDVQVNLGNWNEGNVLFNDALNTFYLRLYGIRHMVKDHSDSEKGNPLPPHGLLFPISSNGSFICTIPQTG